MSAILIRNARVITMLAPWEEKTPPRDGRRGMPPGSLGVLPKADVLIREGQVAHVARQGHVDDFLADAPPDMVEIDARGRVLMPGFVDCHTHACWAGSRIDEWQQKLAGATYQEIAAAGGGIMSTVHATRAASRDDLAAGLRDRLRQMVRFGSTTVEVKSGYGLTAEHELKMLAAIEVARVFGLAKRSARPGPTIVPTALLGHAIDPAVSGFVDVTVNETLPRLSEAHKHIPVDAFCEAGAWSRADCERLFDAAKRLGHPIRVHADQFTSHGMVESAIRLGARSVDHLEASTAETRSAIAESDTFAVGLPICGFHLDGRYARLGDIVNAGGKVCVATNYNPGSAPSPSMPLAIALAVRHCGLTPEQAIVAATLNPACLLGLDRRGYIAQDAWADLILLHHTDERALPYEVGGNPVAMVIIRGVVQE